MRGGSRRLWILSGGGAKGKYMAVVSVFVVNEGDLHVSDL